MIKKLLHLILLSSTSLFCMELEKPTQRTHTRKRSTSAHALLSKNSNAKYSSEEYKLFCCAQKLASIMRNSFQSRDNLPIAQNQIKSHEATQQSIKTIYFYFEDDIPAGIWLPWGNWKLWNNKTRPTAPCLSSGILLEYIRMRIDFKIVQSYKKPTSPSFASFGPVYKVKKIRTTSDKTISVPTLKNKALFSLSQWHAMYAQFCKENNAYAITSNSESSQNQHIQIKRSTSSPRKKIKKNSPHHPEEESPRTDSNASSPRSNISSPRSDNSSPRKGSPRFLVNIFQ